MNCINCNCTEEKICYNDTVYGCNTCHSIFNYHNKCGKGFIIRKGIPKPSIEIQKVMRDLISGEWIQ